MLSDGIVTAIKKPCRFLRYMSHVVVLATTLLLIDSLFAKTYGVLNEETAIVSADIYVEPFFPGGTYEATISEPDGVLGYPLGSKPVNYNEVVRYLEHLVEASPRVQLKKYAETYEGRALYYIIISSQKNIERLEEIKTSTARLADPRKLQSEKEALSLIENTPAVAWLAYCIHGSELSPTDAALQLAYQLTAGTDSLTEKLRDELIIIIDPLQNPDGRERYVSQLNQLAGTVPNLDVQSLQHGGFWPWGRGNHYLFDLNRDWLSLVHPETRGKVRAFFEWNPQLFVDAHEMGSFNTFLSVPPNEPYNPNITKTIEKWWKIFSRDQAHAFDQYGWSYYTREWYDAWYPGFGSHWALYTCAVGILYEQAGVQGSLLKQPDGNILSYRESVHHHFVSSMANLTTAANHRKELLQDFYREKKRAIEDKRAHPARAFIFSPGENATKTNHFIETLLLQDIEVYIAENDFVANDLHDIWGQTIKEKRFPRNTYIVPLDQPMRPLIQTILEFDPRIPDSILVEERHELERNRSSRIYEVTAWSVPIAYNLDAYWTGKKVQKKTKPINKIETPQGKVIHPNSQYGYLFDYTNDAAVSALIIFLQTGYKVRVAEEPFRIEGISFPRGTVLLRNQGNPEELHEFVHKVAKEAGIIIYGVNTALSEEGPDLGGEQFRLLKLPRIGIVAGSSIDFTSYGALWYLLDREFQIRYSSLNINSISWLNLEKYNVLIFPQVWGGPEGYKRLLGSQGIAKLRTWIERGGTLIAIGTGAAFAADTSVGLSSVRLRRQVLDKIGEYEEAVAREQAAIKPFIDSKAVWGISKPVEKIPEAKEKLGLEEITKKDERGRLFMLRGSILRADLDQEHWLTSGMNDKVPVFLYTDFALMSKDPVQTAARLADEKNIRLSGLVWPEARSRWARTAYLTREGLGKGQVILFANDPYFRGYFHGSKRLLANALLLGPGCGTQHTAPW